MNESYDPLMEEQEEEQEEVGKVCNRTQLLIFVPLVQTVFSLLYVFIGVCGFLGNGLIVLAAVRFVISNRALANLTTFKALNLIV
jgi:hypothetical protein